MNLYLYLYLLFRIFAKVSKSITGRKLQHICGELCGVIGIEDLCKMLIMSKDLKVNRSLSLPLESSFLLLSVFMESFFSSW